MLFFLSKGINYIQIGTLYAIREIVINILEIPTGAFADLLGRRKTMMVSFLLYILSFVFFYFSVSYGYLILAMLAFSFGDAMRSGTHKAMIFDYLQLHNWSSEKVSYYGHTRSWSQLGSAISSLLAAGIVIFTGNYQVVFLVSTLPYFVNFVLVWSYPNILDGPIKKEHSLNLSGKLRQFSKALKLSLKSSSLWIVYLNIATFQGYFKSIKDYLQPIILLAVSASVIFTSDNAELNAAWIIGVVYFIIYLISSFSSRQSGKIVVWVKSSEKVINITLILGLLAGIVSGVLINADFSGFAIVVFILIFVVQNIRKPIGSSLVADKVNNDILATGLSVQSLLDSLLTAIFAIVMGFLVEWCGLGNALLILGLSLLIISQLLRVRIADKSK